jgi:hypothetical protein
MRAIGKRAPRQFSQGAPAVDWFPEPGQILPNAEPHHRSELGRERKKEYGSHEPILTIGESRSADFLRRILAREDRDVPSVKGLSLNNHPLMRRES